MVKDKPNVRNRAFNSSTNLFIHSNDANANGDSLIDDPTSDSLNIAQNNVETSNNDNDDRTMNATSNGVSNNNDNDNVRIDESRGSGYVTISSLPSLSRDVIMKKYEKVAELLMIAGSYMTAIEMTWHAIDVETRELGERWVGVSMIE